MGFTIQEIIGGPLEEILEEQTVQRIKPATESTRQLIAELYTQSVIQGNLIQRICRRFHVSPEDANDLVQDAFVKICKYGDNLVNENLDALLQRVVWRISLNFKRASTVRYKDLKQRRMQPPPNGVYRHNTSDNCPVAAQRNALVDRVHLKVLGEEVTRLTGFLASNEQGQAFLSHYRDGRSYLEIGMDMGKSTSAVKNLSCRAKTDIQFMLTDERGIMRESCF